MYQPPGPARHGMKRRPAGVRFQTYETARVLFPIKLEGNEGRGDGRQDFADAGTADAGHKLTSCSP